MNVYAHLQVPVFIYIKHANLWSLEDLVVQTGGKDSGMRRQQNSLSLSLSLSLVRVLYLSLSQRELVS